MPGRGAWRSVPRKEVEATYASGSEMFAGCLLRGRDGVFIQSLERAQERK